MQRPCRKAHISPNGGVRTQRDASVFCLSACRPLYALRTPHGPRALSAGRLSCASVFCLCVHRLLIARSTPLGLRTSPRALSAGRLFEDDHVGDALSGASCGFSTLNPYGGWESLFNRMAGFRKGAASNALTARRHISPNGFRTDAT